MTLILSLTAGMFGLLAGSFANVCILRIPAGESVVLPPSRCPSCGERLRPWELIPLAGFLCLRGRCAHCGARISRQYPAVEASCALLWALCTALCGVERLFLALLGCLFATILLILSVIDARTREIPPGCNIAIALLGIARLLWEQEQRLSCLLGALAVSLPLLLVYALTGGRGIGGGDIKLTAAAGLLLGWQNILLGFVFGCVLGSAVHPVRMKCFGAGRELAMGPYLSAGLFTAFLWGDRAVAWYTALLAG